MANILIFGSSVTYGCWDKEGGWPQRLKMMFDREQIKAPYKSSFYKTYNLGVSDNSTLDVLERFEFETKQRLNEEQEAIIILAVGLNDIQFIHSQNSLRVSAEVTRENISRLIQAAQKFTSKLLFLGLSPVDDSKTAPIYWNHDVTFKNEYIEERNEVIKSVCKENKVDFIDILEEFLKKDYKKLLEDGLHPNTEGHKLIFEIVKDYLIKSKTI